jgi:hypothetical protein
MSIVEIYEQTIRPLSATDRVGLAKLILNGLPPEAIVDFREEWSDEDREEFTHTGWKRADHGEVKANDNSLKAADLVTMDSGRCGSKEE